VADEVRNLAQRAAEAAKETTGLIEDSVNKAKDGTEVAGEVGNALGAIVADVTKVTDLIKGISKASEEQAQGVDQVNTAVSQMDKVTQQNAAGAEESASAAEELSAQAQTVKGMVDELSFMVGGSSRQKRLSSIAKDSEERKSCGSQKRFNTKVANIRKSPQPALAEAEAGSSNHTPPNSGGESCEDFMKMNNSGNNGNDF
jgi:methyl-accepting chemotaxis protein